MSGAGVEESAAHGDGRWRALQPAPGRTRDARGSGVEGGGHSYFLVPVLSSCKDTSLGAVSILSTLQRTHEDILVQFRICVRTRYVFVLCSSSISICFARSNNKPTCPPRWPALTKRLGRLTLPMGECVEHGEHADHPVLANRDDNELPQ